MILRKLNKMKTQKVNKSKWWCEKCDTTKVGAIGKCKNCNNKINNKKIKGS
jgi:rubrerythrin